MGSSRSARWSSTAAASSSSTGGLAAPIEVLGDPLLDLLPVAPLAGNLGLSFVALSYAGRLTITVRADADRFPDLEVLSTAMERDWQALAGSVAPI